MKIKCPACSKVLNVAESAAGKVIRCPCGKKLRAPAGAASTSPGPAPNPSHHATSPALSNAPAVGMAPAAAAQPIAGAGDSMFDELTEDDLAPVKPVAQPGFGPTVGSNTKQMMANYGKEVEAEKAAHRRGVRADALKYLRQSIGILLFLGGVNVGLNIFLLLGVSAEVDLVLGQDAPEEAKAWLRGLLIIVYSVGIGVGSIFLFCAGLVFMFPMTCAIVALVFWILTQILGFIVNPLGLISVRGWIVRAAIFGALVQTINSASYYKFVKGGGRDTS